MLAVRAPPVQDDELPPVDTVVYVQGAMDVTPAAHAAAFWTGLNLILLLVLSVLVVRQRRLHRVALGDGGVPQLNQAIRLLRNPTTRHRQLLRVSAAGN